MEKGHLVVGLSDYGGQWSKATWWWDSVTRVDIGARPPGGGTQ